MENTLTNFAVIKDYIYMLRAKEKFEIKKWIWLSRDIIFAYYSFRPCCFRLYLCIELVSAN